MASICFVGTYPPIMCGIATYTKSLTLNSRPGKWSVLSFDLDTYGAPLMAPKVAAEDPVLYGIPGGDRYSSDDVVSGLANLGKKPGSVVLWFQHETAIWADHVRFVRMLRELRYPKVVTFHTLHFQSEETPSGLRRYQYDLLQALLPYVDAITVFTYGVYWAVISAFPEYCHKIYVINHGVRSYPSVSGLSRMEAKRRFSDFLLHESALDDDTKEALKGGYIFSDPDTVVLGQTGFLCPLKQSESLYLVRDKLEAAMSGRRIIAVRVGQTREEAQKVYAHELRREANGSDKYLLEMWLPQQVLPLAQRAFDVNFYWPTECTQSGVLSHALGAGAIVASRDLEGVGETLKQVGMLVDTDLDGLTLKIRDALTSPERMRYMEERALRYAREFSWENQARRHYDLAEPVLYGVAPWAKPCAAGGTSEVFKCQATPDIGTEPGMNPYSGSRFAGDIAEVLRRPEPHSGTSAESLSPQKHKQRFWGDISRRTRRRASSS